VLRARDYSESDRIVSLLTLDFGKLSGIAKGAKASRRRFEGKLEPFSHVRLYFRRRPHGQLVFITRAERGDTPTAQVADDLRKIALGSYMLELADALTREEAEAAGAYRVLAEALGVLGGLGATLSLRHAFELKLLTATGFGLEFATCRICGASPEPDSAIYFVVTRGGIVCARCRAAAPESAVKMATTNASALASLAAASFDEAAQLADGGSETTAAIARFLATILDRRLRSVEFLNSVL
jgi:DNA repair protein RecO (recombination protein O)